MPYDIPVPHCFRKQGIYYFERRVPRDLEGHYTAKKIAYSLRTRSPSVAASRATRAAQRLDEHWYYLRIKDRDLPGKHLLRQRELHREQPELPTGGPASQAKTPSVSLSEAVGIYLKLKGQNRPATFHRAAERSCGYLIDVCGDQDLLAYARADATRFRDALIERGLAGSSITRVLGTVRSIINFAASELGVTVNNPFTGVYYDRQSGVKGRATLPPDDLANVQAQCRLIDDDMRWLVTCSPDCPRSEVKSVPGLVLL